MPVLSQRALNRAVLARQGLLERHATTLPETLRRIGGIQAQYSPSGYVGLWSRMRDFAFADLTAALLRRTAIQATLQRATIHLVHRREYWPAREATRETMRLKAEATMPVPDDLAARVAEVAEALREGPMARKDVEALIGKPATRLLNVELDLVRVPPQGTWETPRANLWGLAADWVGPSDSDPVAGRVALVESYLRGFGPATRHELAHACGVSLLAVDAALGTLTLRESEAEDGARLLDLPRLPLPDPDTPAPVRLLPTWDQTLIAHNRRAALIAEEDRLQIFHVRAPQSYPVFLVDGRAAGTWHLRELTYEPWRPLDAADRRALEAELERLRAALP